MSSPIEDGRLPRLRRSLSRSLITPIIPVLSALGLTPNHLTWMGLAIAGGAGALAATGSLVAAGLVVLASGLFDLLDGALARATQRASTAGAFLDSNLDRVGEGAVLFGILVHVAREGALQDTLLIFLALAGSFLVSYVKARAEGLGLSCNVGFFTRPERVLVLAIALLIGHLTIPLYLFVMLSFLTAAQRFLHVWRPRES
jgi:CDP-diacylglycerol--glycerol-3-phosphate 3-phosphatidyltransferase